MQAFLEPLGVEDLWGVGAKTAERLARFGLRTVGELAALDRATLSRLVGVAAAAQLTDLAHGRDPRPVVARIPAKGLSAEETFASDVDDPVRLRRELLRLAEKVAQRLRRRELAARTVTLKLRYANFTTVTRSHTLQAPTDQATDLHREVVVLLDALRLERARVRLVGVGAHNLVPASSARQLDLLDSDRWARLERAADVARERFGDTAVTRGALLDG